MAKCRRYIRYYQSGAEQKKTGVFPLVVWIVPGTARKESLLRNIREAFPKWLTLFRVITPDELAPLLVRGTEPLNDEKGGGL